MKWFEHQTSAALNKKIRKIEKHYYEEAEGSSIDPDQAAMAASGRYWRLLEVIGREGLDPDGKDIFELPADYTMELLADDLRCGIEYLEKFLNLLSEINAIDPEAWAEKRIYCPKMAERADTYTKRSINKEQTSNTIRTRSAKVVPTNTNTNTNTNTKKRVRTARTVSSGNGRASSPPVFKSLFLEISKEFFDDLQADYPALPPEKILKEVKKANDWLLDNPNKRKRKANGHLKNPRLFLRNWFEKVEATPDTYHPPIREQPPPPELPPLDECVFPEPDCPDCHGTGLANNGPCICLRRLTPDEIKRKRSETSGDI